MTPGGGTARGRSRLPRVPIYATVNDNSAKTQHGAAYGSIKNSVMSRASSSDGSASGRFKNLGGINEIQEGLLKKKVSRTEDTR